MDWVADDHAVIVEMNRLMKKNVEFNAAWAQLKTFICLFYTYDAADDPLTLDPGGLLLL